MIFQTRIDLRSLVGALGAILCVGSMLLSPLAASQPPRWLNADRMLSEIRDLPTLPENRASRERAIVVARDPFVVPPEALALAQRRRASQKARSVIEVEGIIDGERPRALVRIEGVEQIVAIGDTLEGDLVVGIADGAIRLASGAQLRPRAQSTP